MSKYFTFATLLLISILLAIFSIFASYQVVYSATDNVSLSGNITIEEINLDDVTASLMGMALVLDEGNENIDDFFAVFEDALDDLTTALDGLTAVLEDALVDIILAALMCAFVALAFWKEEMTLWILAGIAVVVYAWSLFDFNAPLSFVFGLLGFYLLFRAGLKYFRGV